MLANVYAHSPFKNLLQLAEQIVKVGDHGTAVCLYNLFTGPSTLDLDSDPLDVRVHKRPDQPETFVRPGRPRQHADIPVDYSLRSYCGMLYLTTSRDSTGATIEINGKEVKQKTVDDIISVVCGPVVYYVHTHLHIKSPSYPE